LKIRVQFGEDPQKKKVSEKGQSKTVQGERGARADPMGGAVPLRNVVGE